VPAAVSDPLHLWEEAAVAEDGDYTERLRVPGGWLYRCWMRPSGASGDEGVVLAITFVPELP
jgi:hypothetical protein